MESIEDLFREFLEDNFIFIISNKYMYIYFDIKFVKIVDGIWNVRIGYVYVMWLFRGNEGLNMRIFLVIRGFSMGFGYYLFIIRC